MGAWGTGIKDNDTSSDIYADFFDRYNEGQDPFEISNKLIAENTELINNPDNCNNFWFALALAQWEIKALDNSIFATVKNIIETEQDLKVWKDLDADDDDIQKRKIALEKFLIKLQTVKAKAKPKEKPSTPVFQAGDCICFKHKNDNYGGAVVLAADNSKFGWNLVVTTKINQPSKPAIDDFQKSEALILNYAGWKKEPYISWYLPRNYKKKFGTLFELIGNIPVQKKYSPNEKGLKATISGGWNLIIESFERQSEHEKSNPSPKTRLTIQELVNNKKWWKLW